MSDINDIRQKMMDDLKRETHNDPALQRYRKAIQDSDSAAASQYSIRCGELLSKVLTSNMTDDVFQESSVDDLGQLLMPVIRQEFEYVSNAVSAAQRSMNEDAGIGIKPIRSDMDVGQYYNLFGKMQIYDSFEDASWLLDEPITLDSLRIVDETQRENAEFHYKSGLRTKVIRTIESDRPCAECEDAAGEYYYPDVPDDVWYRHNGCRCEIRIETEKDGREYLSNSSYDTAKRIEQYNAIQDENAISSEINSDKRKYNSSSDFYVAPNGKAIPAKYQSWIGENQMQNVMSQCISQEAKKVIRQDFRKSSVIGDGDTYSIRVFELSTGLNCGRNGNSHEQKVRDLIRFTEKTLLKDIPETDRILLEERLKKLQEVI